MPALLFCKQDSCHTCRRRRRGPATATWAPSAHAAGCRSKRILRDRQEQACKKPDRPVLSQTALSKIAQSLRLYGQSPQFASPDFDSTSQQEWPDISQVVHISRGRITTSEIFG